MSPVVYRELPAPAPLDRLIHCFWFLRGSMDLAAPEPVVPDGRLELILHRGEPFARADGAGPPRRQDDTLVAGQLTAPIYLQPMGPVDVVGIRFRSAGARAVLALPLGEVAGQVLSLAFVSPRLAAALSSAAATHREPTACAAALSRILGEVARREIDPLVRSAVAVLARPEAPPIRVLGRSLGVSARTLERRVLDEVGLAPRTLARVLRFRRAFRLLDRSAPGSWSRSAAAAGYFDQAHLIRDFRRFAGAPPTTFFRVDPNLARAFVGP
ncbi:MAG: AraC family transcriptional regulator [Gemmatimonadales bacterium]